MSIADFDGLDHRIIQALYLDGRVSFRRLAEVLDTSEQTVARRYRQLQQRYHLRVVGQLDSQRIGQSDWVVRIRCTPDAAMPVAQALAARPDTSWVQLASGGTEIICTVRSHDERDRTALLLDQLPANRRIVSLEAHCLIHMFASGVVHPTGSSGLEPHQREALRAPLPERPTASAAVDSDGRGSTGLRDTDWPLIHELREDGRATYRALASATHWHESTVRRRVEELIATGVLYFDVDVHSAALGMGSRSLLWMSVAPSHLMEAGAMLGGRPEIPFAAATTGPTNLIASLGCRDDYALFDFLTKEIAQIPGITKLETSPIMRSVKQHAVMVPAA